VTTSVGIVGFRGYSGAELVRLLQDHPHVDTVLLEHRSDSGAPVLPRGAKRPQVMPCSADAVGAAGLSAVFLATPPEVSMELTPGFLQAGAKVIDLSGAFRLRTAENYKHWYKADHGAPELFSEAAYGLPEVCRERIKGAQLVSNPGCYPTAANLAIRPLVQAALIDRNAGIVCDAKSGVSGAGRKASLKTSFCEVAENFSAYSLFDHRHVPEFTFVAQLIPIDRGILETIYFRGTPGTTTESIMSAYDSAYRDAPFVRTYDPGVMPDLHAVQRTNFCDIGVKYDAATRRGVIVAVIDNLGKGAAGQAVQNMNLVLGFAEQEGLI
jgi:N-acetyl-gamma-glutamyl-phosphate reductase